MPIPARLRPEGLQWPYTLAMLRQDEPQLSISAAPHAGEIASWLALDPPVVYIQPEPTEPPAHDPVIHRAVEAPPIHGEDGIWRQAWQLEQLPPPPEPPPVPDWAAFKSFALSHQAVNAAIAAAIPLAPAAALALPAALLRAEQGELADFQACWAAVSGAVEIPPRSAAELIIMARRCNLPDEFVAALLAN